jgi:alpha-glucosidase (family GH31 glycosyl hydrolase)
MRLVLLVTLLAVSLPAATKTITSSALQLTVTPNPYSYQVIERSTGQVLVSENTVTFTIAGVAYQAATASGIITTPTSLNATLALNGTTETAHVQLVFTSPQVLQIQLTANGSAPNSIQEQFVDQGEHVYGIWEYPFTGNLDNRGADEDFNGIQDMADEGHTNARAPFYLTSLKYGVYVQTTAFGHYNIAVNGVTQWFFDSPSLTYDVIYGPTYQQILSRYNAMAGPPVFPPLWALDSIWWRDDDHVGFHGMVMNAQENVLDDATQLQNNQIRAGSLWIDRPYGTGVSGWGNMDFDSSFPDPLQMVGQLHSQGYQLMLWIANLAFNNLYTQGSADGYLFANESGSAANMAVPGASSWFQGQLSTLVNYGISGYKVDRGDVYGTGGEDIPQSYENSTSILFAQTAAQSLAALNGGNYYMFHRNQVDTGRRLSGIWNGDTACTFAALRISMSNALRSGSIIFPMWGSDTGGYLCSSLSEEMFSRWFGFSAYSTMMEVLIGATRTPWYDFDATMVTTAQTYSAVHHDLMPYTRSYLYQSTQTGFPVMIPLIFNYPNDTTLTDTSDEYLFGDQILVAPVLVEGATSRSVYLPAGNWVDYNDRATIYNGPVSITSTADTATTPVFATEGAIIPRGDIFQGNDNWTPGWTPSLRIEVFPSSSFATTFPYYTGTTVQAISATPTGGSLQIKFGNLGMPGSLNVYCTAPASVTLNGVPLMLGTGYTYDAGTHLLTVSFQSASTLVLNGARSVF